MKILFEKKKRERERERWQGTTVGYGIVKRKKQKQEGRWTCNVGNLCICMACGFEKSKIRIVKKNK